MHKLHLKVRLQTNIAKGDLILKGLIGILNSKKRTLCRLVFVHFLEELNTTKNPFETM